MSRYYIDGYNLLFAMTEEYVSHVELVDFLEELLAEAKMKATIIFDNHSPLATLKPSTEYRFCLRVLFSPRGLCADSYILELIQGAENPMMTTVVTSDVALGQSSRTLGATTLTNEEFLKTLFRKTRKKKEIKRTVEGKHELERLRKIFEERYQNLVDY